MEATNKLISIFSEIYEPIRNLTKLNQLNDIFIVGIIPVIYGANSWNKYILYVYLKI